MHGLQAISQESICNNYLKGQNQTRKNTHGCMALVNAQLAANAWPPNRRLVKTASIIIIRSPELDKEEHAWMHGPRKCTIRDECLSAEQAINRDSICNNYFQGQDRTKKNAHNKKHCEWRDGVDNAESQLYSVSRRGACMTRRTITRPN